MANKQKNVETDLNYEDYLKATGAPVLRGELGEILEGLTNAISIELDEVAQPALQSLKAVSILIHILKNKGIIDDNDFIQAEKEYTDRLKEVAKDGRKDND